MTRGRPLLIVGLTVACLTACTGDETERGATSGPAATIAPAGPNRPALGAWAQPTGGHSRERQMAAVTDLEAELGHRLAIDHFYVSDLADPQTWRWRLDWDVENGRVPMISLGFGTDTRQIAAGRFDPLLRSYAAAISAGHAQRVMIRYAFEMDGAANQEWVHSGPDFVAAWKHVRSIFADLPVEWVWSPNAPAFGGSNGGVDQYWPGDGQVDWIAADGYNFYTCADHRRWKTFDEIFASFLTWGAQKGKPLMLAEFGSLDDPEQPTRQAGWIADVVNQASEYPQLKALVYYNSDGHGCDWRLDSSDRTSALLSDLGLSDRVAEVPA